MQFTMVCIGALRTLEAMVLVQGVRIELTYSEFQSDALPLSYPSKIGVGVGFDPTS